MYVKIAASDYLPVIHSFLEILGAMGLDKDRAFEWLSGPHADMVQNLSSGRIGRPRYAVQQC